MKHRTRIYFSAEQRADIRHRWGFNPLLSKTHLAFRSFNRNDPPIRAQNSSSPGQQGKRL